ncbi:MAG: hypothetical protein U5P41_09205 [Gammaproteobacteria bacterium]|nr:hypothetical protein [Gammaproteobacteria bacterium]
MLLYQVDLRKPKFRLLDILTGSGHIDNLAYRDGVFYATDQYYSKVINYRIERDRIKQVGEMIGYDFPHGLDIRDDLLAVSNYGDNSVVINRL